MKHKVFCIDGKVTYHSTLGTAYHIGVDVSCLRALEVGKTMRLNGHRIERLADSEIYPLIGGGHG